jgi:hypothetical protein
VWQRSDKAHGQLKEGEVIPIPSATAVKESSVLLCWGEGVCLLVGSDEFLRQFLGGQILEHSHMFVTSATCKAHAGNAHAAATN